MAHIQAVLFDFGKVLTLGPRTHVWDWMQQLCGVEVDTLQRGYWAHRDSYDAGMLTGEEYWRLVCEKPLSAETMQGLKAADVELWTDMNQPMLRWMAGLHAAGVRTGILSNMPEAMAEGLTRKFPWLATFHHIVWSHELKMRKPQPEIYAASATGLQVPAEQILFIDDKWENTAAAAAVGMQAIAYHDHESFVLEMKARGYGYLLQI